MPSSRLADSSAHIASQLIRRGLAFHPRPWRSRPDPRSCGSPLQTSPAPSNRAITASEPFGEMVGIGLSGVFPDEVPAFEELVTAMGQMLRKLKTSRTYQTITST